MANSIDISGGGTHNVTVTIPSGETLTVDAQLANTSTITVTPGAVLIADKLSFILPAKTITLQATDPNTGGELEIKQLPPITHADFFANHLTLTFASGSQATLNTAPSPLGLYHASQTPQGDFFFAPPTISIPATAHAIPTTLHP